MTAISDNKYSPVQLQERLRELSGKNILLMLTDNTRTMLSQRKDSGVLTIRMHRMFLDADDSIIQALALWIRGRNTRQDLIEEFIEKNTHKIRIVEPQERGTTINTKGRYHDLKALAEEINETYLQNRSQAVITWGRKVGRKRTNSVRLGWYDPVRNLISISQRLDRRDIPRYMVEFVLFHEMLHEILGIGERADGKRDIHGKTFKLMEQTYPYYQKALAFERKKWGMQ